MHNGLFKILLFFICYLRFSSIIAQELPLVHNFLPRVYKAQNQNWAISQDENKIIYVANNKGLLVYNGVEWKLYKSPNETIIRSVKVVKDKVYTGSYMEFGYWKRDDFNDLKYQSLSQKIKNILIEDEQFWNILHFENKILFQSLNRIYLYDLHSKTYDVINSTSVITKIYQTVNGIYYQKIGQGLFKIKNGNEVLISNTKIFKENRIINVFQSNNNLLVLTQKKGFFNLSDKGELKPWQTSLNTNFKNSSIYNAIQVENKGFGLGTVSNGFILLDKNGAFQYQLNKKRGLNNNTILSLFEDVDRNIWLGLDSGISLVNQDSPITIYKDFTGHIGSVYTSIIFKDNLYLGTNQGLFFKKLHSKKNFLFIKGTKGQVWSLRAINNTLFCGHDTGSFIIDKEKVVKIADIDGAWDFKKIDDHFILQGNYDGLYLLEKYKDLWKVKNKIEGFNISSKHFEILNNHQIFVNHEYKGVFKLDVNKDFTKIIKSSRDTSKIGIHSSLVSYQNKIYYAFKEGLFKYISKKSRFVKDTTLSKIYTKDFISGKLIVENNELWAFSKSSLIQVSPRKLSNTFKINKIFLSKSIRNSIDGYEHILRVTKKKYLLCSASGYLIIDISKLPKKDFEVKLSRILLKGHAIKKELKGLFKNKDNNLLFNFYVATFNQYFQPVYQYKLTALENDWSYWSNTPYRLFESLPAGDYNFMLRARIGNKPSKNAIVYSFKIKRPWYANNFMISIYILAIILFSLFMHTLYRKYYQRQQKKLIERNQKELKLARVENEKEIIKIRNEKLREDFKSKSKELASSIMSIVKKNELLTNIKENIAKAEDKKLQPVIFLIDENLKNNDDWEFFQEAFNNADSEFLKRLKGLHSNLSPNDLRLCAYLRLNLSSKEIAPLFNISARSVEIKRYRLRKKMNLPHENNLVDYILNL